MKLYHASKHRFDVIKRNQVEVPDGIVVPEGELQNKIYLTPDIGYAIAMAAGPEGMTVLHDNMISFENAVDFDPDKVIYVYEVDSESIPKELLEKVDEEQVVVDLDELEPLSVAEYTAESVFNYYKLTDWTQQSTER